LRFGFLLERDRKDGLEMAIVFSEFIESVEDKDIEFVEKVHQILSDLDYKCEIKTAKQGYIVSYLNKKTKRTLATYVRRKSGLKLRLYPAHINDYESFLGTMPKQMIKAVEKSSVCKRMIDPEACNSRCVMGYAFDLSDTHYQKCRYSAFQFDLNEDNNPYLLAFLDKELSCR